MHTEDGKFDTHEKSIPDGARSDKCRALPLPIRTGALVTTQRKFLLINVFEYAIINSGQRKGEIRMPEISRFYGIVIKMFFKPKEHEPSHLHALYGEHVGIFDLRTMEMTEGDLPKRACDMVQEWMAQNQKELLEMWDNQNLKKLPPL